MIRGEEVASAESGRLPSGGRVVEGKKTRGEWHMVVSVDDARTAFQTPDARATHGMNR
jgi:hypothetical protein